MDEVDHPAPLPVPPTATPPGTPAAPSGPTTAELERKQRILERRLTRQLELKQFEQKVSKKQKPAFDHLEHTDKSRKHIAFVFVYGYIILVALIIVGVPIYNWAFLDKPELLDLEKILAQAGALIGSPLGFVVGYYFKEDMRKQ